LKKFWSLFRMQLNVHFGFSALKYRYLVARKRVWEPLLIIFALLSLLPVAKSYWGFLVELFFALKMANQEFLLVAAGVLTGQLVVLILGLFYVMSAFYYSRDLDRLIALPLSPGSIIAAKFGVIVVSEWLTMIPVVLPMLLAVGMYGTYGLGYWLRAGVAYLMLPVIPLALVAVVTMLLARATNLPRRRELFRVAAGVIVVLVALGINLFVNTRLASDPEAVEQLLAQSQGLVQLVGERFPPALWLTWAIAGQGLLGGWLQLTFVAALSLGAVWVLSRFAQGLFLSGYLHPGSGPSTSTEREKAGALGPAASGVVPADFTASTSLVALFKREWLLLLRTPIWMFNVVGGLIVPLVIIPIIFFTQEGVGELLRASVFETARAQNLVLVIAGGIALFIVGATSMAGSAVSREGRFVWISKSIPVEASEQLLAKGLHTLAFGVPVILLFSIGAYLMLSLRLLLICGVVVVGVLGGVLVTALGLLVDMYRPNLDWSDPQRAMKSNLNPLISLAAAAVIYGAPTALLIRLLGDASPLLAAGLLSVWLVLAIGATAQYVRQHAAGCYLAMGD